MRACSHSTPTSCTGWRAPESGIKSIADFKGKRFVPGQVASATEVNSREMMDPSA